MKKVAFLAIFLVSLAFLSASILGEETNTVTDANTVIAECVSASDCEQENCADGTTIQGECVEGRCAMQECPPETECKGEGETIPVIADPPECCADLTLIPPKEELWVGISGYCTAKCGDGVCNTEIESMYNCPADCAGGGPVCGNGACEGAWEEQNCPADCLIQECPPITCALYCEHGFKKDADGCAICECIEPEKGTLVLHAFDEYGNQITVGLFGVIYKLPNGEAVAKIELLNGTGTTELAKGNYSVTVTDPNRAYQPAKTDFQIEAGIENIVRIILREAQGPVCGNGVCEEGEADSCPTCYEQPCSPEPCREGTCPIDCTEPCVCPEIYSPVCGVNGKTYSNSCVATCEGIAIAYQGECRSDSIRVELGNAFELKEKQKALLLDNGSYTGIDVQLTQIRHSYTECDWQGVCVAVDIVPTVQLQVTKTEGSMVSGTSVSLGVGQSVEVFGITFTNLRIGTSTASFVANRETEPGVIRVSLGEKFTLSQNQTANVLKSGQSVMKIKFDSLITTGTCGGGGGTTTTTTSGGSGGGTSTTTASGGGSTISPSDTGGGDSGGGITTCYEETYAQFQVSLAGGGSHYVSLKDNQTTRLGNYSIYLVELARLESYPVQYRATLVVKETIEPETVIAYLGRPFDLQENQTAIVKETRLQLKLIDLYNDLAVVEVLQPIVVEPTPSSGGSGGTVARTMEAEAVVTEAQRVEIIEEAEAVVEEGVIVYRPYIKLAIGQTETVYGHTISLNDISIISCIPENLSCTGGLLANLTVTKEVVPEPRRVFLNEKFELAENQTAIVLNRPAYSSLPASEVMRVKLLGIAYPTCEAPEYGREEGIICDSRPVAKVSVQLPAAECLEYETCPGIATMIVLREGEERTVGGYPLRLLDIYSGKAVFIVRGPMVTEIIKVRLDERFKLQEMQTALVVEENLYIKLQGTAIVKCLSDGAKCIGGSYATVGIWKNYVYKEGGEVPIAIYTIREGDSLNLYGVKITLLELGTDTAGFIVTKPESNIINVRINETFKLKQRQAARVLEANMRIDLLSIRQYTCITAPCLPSEVEISVSNYLLSVEETGKAVQSSEYIEQVVESSGETTTSTGGAGGGGSSIPIPPMPFNTYTLSEGQSATVNDFVIKVLSIGYEYAEFVVTKRGSNERVHIELASGWNLFSIPGNLDVIESSECESRDLVVLEYVEETGEFVKVTTGELGQAYWLYNPGEKCSVSAILRDHVSMSDIDSLKRGWNFAPVTADMVGHSVQELGSQCSLKAAYFYNAETRKWENVLGRRIASTDLGKAFALYAASECRLGGALTPPMPGVPGGG